MATFAALMPLAACGARASSGPDDFMAPFEAWYAANPPPATEPPRADRELLERHRPVYYLGAEAADPIDFYETYLRHGSLYDGDGALLAASPSRAELNAVRLRYDTVFEYDADAAAATATASATAAAPPAPVYGRIDRTRGDLLGRERNLVLLTYTLVFAHSGLPAELRPWQEWAARLFGDADDWHQLDHYINTTVVLDESESGAPIPVAVQFQHHNYTRTWRLGGAPGRGRLEWPANGRLEVDIALRSNEAYPHNATPQRHRATSFLSRTAAEWFTALDETTVKRPKTAAYDKTNPERVLDAMPLIALPPADAFYTHRGTLGAIRRLPGRSGPPGADYSTLPGFKPPFMQFLVSYHHPGMVAWPALVEAARAEAWGGANVDPAPFRALFEADWNASF